MVDKVQTPAGISPDDTITLSRGPVLPAAANPP
jgi:hypothetical protein